MILVFELKNKLKIKLQTQVFIFVKTYPILRKKKIGNSFCIKQKSVRNFLQVLLLINAGKSFEHRHVLFIHFTLYSFAHLLTNSPPPTFPLCEHKSNCRTSPHNLLPDDNISLDKRHSTIHDKRLCH